MTVRSEIQALVFNVNNINGQLQNAYEKTRRLEVLSDEAENALEIYDQNHSQPEAVEKLDRSYPRDFNYWGILR